MPKIFEGNHKAAKLRLAIVVSRFNEGVTTRLLAGALSTIDRLGGDTTSTDVIKVPGAFEIPLAAKKLAETRRYDGVVCLGAVIRGETPHFDYICSAASLGIQDAMLVTGVPMSFGVITADTAQHAAERSSPGQRNKGEEATLAVIEMANLLKRIS